MKHLLFRCSEQTFQKYIEILDQLRETADYSPDHYSLIDEIKSLPGFPRGVDVNTRVGVSITTIH